MKLRKLQAVPGPEKGTQQDQPTALVIPQGSSVEPLMTREEVIAVLRISRTTLWRRLCSPTEDFPIPIRLSRDCWRRSDILRYLERKQTESLNTRRRAAQ